MEHKELMDTIETAIQMELEHARANFQSMVNGHDGYARTLEEFEELQTEVDTLKSYLVCLWNSVKDNDLNNQKHSIERLKLTIREVIKEAVQVGAMCQRYSEDVLKEIAEGVE